MSEMKIVIKGNEKVNVDFSKHPTATLNLKTASVSGNDGKKVILKLETEDYPDDIDPSCKEPKLITKTEILAELTDKEVELSAILEDSSVPKLYIEGSGEVTVVGSFKEVACDEDDDSSEESNEQNENDDDEEEDNE